MNQIKAESIKENAILFYRNEEKAAYQMVNELLPGINQTLQELLGMIVGEKENEELQNYILNTLTEFVQAYKMNDNLALADLLYYAVSEEVELYCKLKAQGV
ncbi:MAG: hypothetical protein ACI4ES_03350 [Roseburia sp.]